MEGIRGYLSGIERALIGYSRLFGTGIVDPAMRMFALLGAFALLHALALAAPPIIGWICAWLGYWGVIGIGRAWVANEKLRGAVAKKIEDLDVDTLPDLRAAALVSALQLIVLIPFLLQNSHELFGLYAIPYEADGRDWILFSFDLLCKAILDWSEVYGVQFSDIGYENIWGRHLVMLLLLTIDFILIQGLIRIFEIRRVINDGVRAVQRDPEMAARLGARATLPLIESLRGTTSQDGQRAILEAFGIIGDPRACRAIFAMLEEEELHTTAVAALVAIRSYQDLFEGLDHPEEATRLGIISAIGHLEDPRAVPALKRTYAKATTRERTRIVRAWSRIDDPAVKNPLIRALKDDDATVRLAAVRGSGRFSDEAMMTALLLRLEDEDAEVRLATASALARFEDGRIVEPLVKSLEDTDSRVSEQARRTLEHLEAVATRRRSTK